MHVFITSSIVYDVYDYVFMMLLLNDLVPSCTFSNKKESW